MEGHVVEEPAALMTQGLALVAPATALCMGPSRSARDEDVGKRPFCLLLPLKQAGGKESNSQRVHFIRK